MEKMLYCGAAKADITPREEEAGRLFGLMGIEYAGIIDRLALRVIALRSGENRALIVSFDLDKAPEPKTWLPELAEHTGIPEEYILYFATHTHSAPLTTVRPRERNECTPAQRACMNAYETVVHEKLLSCAEEAIAGMKPARMGCAWGESFVNTNRNARFVQTDENGQRWPFINEGMNWGAPVDRTLLAIRFEDLEGCPLAFFFNYPMHCCMMFLNNFDGQDRMGISGDVAGNISRLAEEKYPGAVALWSSGAAGDVDPVLFNVLIYPDPTDGHVVKETIRDWRMSEAQLRMITAWHFKDICEALQTLHCDQTEAEISAALTWAETPGAEDPYRIRMQGLRVGPALLLGIGGELYNSFGRMLREQSPAPYTAIVNHTASLIDDAGYILDDETLAAAKLDAPCRHFIPGGRARFQPGCVGPELKRRLESLSKELNL